VRGDVGVVETPADLCRRLLQVLEVHHHPQPVEGLPGRHHLDAPVVSVLGLDGLPTVV